MTATVSHSVELTEGERWVKCSRGLEVCCRGFSHQAMLAFAYTHVAHPEWGEQILLRQFLVAR
jgi:hypothetical protein